MRILLLLPLLTGCFHPQYRAYGNTSSITFVAPTQDEANEFCLQHEPTCHYNTRTEIHR